MLNNIYEDFKDIAPYNQVVNVMIGHGYGSIYKLTNTQSHILSYIDSAIVIVVNN